ncbi:acyl-CoA dehydrogenase family protein [Thermodesulfobacteriota bacterium]
MKLFNEDHEQFRDMVRKFVDKEVIPNRNEWEKNREIPREFWKKLGELGCLGFAYDEKYGGMNLDFIYSVVLTEELTRSRCGGLDAAVACHNDMASTYINLAGTDEQKEKYLPRCITGDAVCGIGVTEPNTGSDVAAIRLTAVRDGDDYILNGQKTFITNGYCGDLIVTAAKTDTNAKPPHRGISLFIVEKGTPGFSSNKLEKMGCHATDTAELFYDDCRVPAANLLGEEGSGFKTTMTNFQKERLIATVMAMGYCDVMIQDTIAYTKERTAFGQPISQFQVNKHKIVEMAAEAEMAKIFTYHIAQEYIEGRDMMKEISMAKYLTSDLANKIAYQCVQLHGGYGYMDEYQISRDYTNVRAHTITGGTNEIMKEIVADRLGL